MRRLFVAGAAVVLLSLSILLPVTAQDPEPDVSRTVHVYRGRPVASVTCTRTEQEVLCSASVPDDVVFNIPSELGRVDITASLTVAYRTSAGDGARLIATLETPADGADQMRPGAFVLGPAPDGTSTTMTWVAPNRQPTDDAYAFGFEITGARGTRGPYKAAVLEAVVVITATPG
jgi:hypothetical protein